MKALLIGESNPYGTNPDYALYPSPPYCAGHRLCFKILGIDEGTYLREYKRVNLCRRAWSIEEAHERAAELVRAYGLADYHLPTAPKRPVFVLLGAKVAQAFSLKFEPFTVDESDPQVVHVLLPHPSGLSRLWHAPGSFERAQRLLRHLGAL